MPKDLIEIITRLGSPRAVVVGDLILDRYVFGKVNRISPEAPIQILKAEHEEVRPGGAANVAANLAVMGSRTVCLGVTGNDANGVALTESLKAKGVDVSGVVRDETRPTTEKTRMIAHNQQVLRIDRETDAPIKERCEEKLIRAIENFIPASDIVLVSDYNKGTLTTGVLDKIFEIARAYSKKVLVGPKGRDFRKYRGACMLTPNISEAELASGKDCNSPEALRAVANKFIEELDLEAIIITRGEQGMSVFRRDGVCTHVPAKTRAVYDVTGAGDTVLATLGLVVACGHSVEVAARIATVAAGIVCGKVGTATVTREEILQELAEHHPVVSGKVIDLPELENVLREYRNKGRKIVFTNGCFDILHKGHLTLLKTARSLGDTVVVGLNSDLSVKKLKGSSRPVLSQNDRAQILAALEYVDYVVIFDEETPLELIKRVQPDVLVKGEDWRERGVVGREFVESRGGRVHLVPLVEGISTSQIMKRISDCR